MNDNKRLIEEVLRKDFLDSSTGETIEELLKKTGSHSICTWKCNECGHEWKTHFYTRAHGHGCPKCRKKEGAAKKNQKMIQIKGSVKDLYPNLIKEWDQKKNLIGPDMILPSSDKKVWWKCYRCGTSWKDSVYNRTNRHRGCPGCKKETEKQKSIAIVCPESLEYWNSRNTLSPYEMMSGSPKHVWWKCPICGHEWEASISGFKRGRRCPACAGKVVTEKNSFAAQNPEDAKYWDYEKNDCTPDQIFFKSNKKYWFHCPMCGKSVKKSPVKLMNRPLICSDCTMRTHTSYGEQFLYYYLSKNLEHVKNRYLYDGKEIDVYLEDQKIAVEYNGVYFHQHREKQDKSKETYFKNHGLKVIKVFEGSDPEIVEEENVYFVSKDQLNDDLEDVVLDIFNHIDSTRKIDIDWKKDRHEILQMYYSSPVKTSISKMFPDLLKEWDHEKNKGLSPDSISWGSHLKVSWICEKGHEWEAAVYARTSGQRCPYCHSNRLLTGFNDLKSEFPELIEKYWVNEMNSKRGWFPEYYKKSSQKKVFWYDRKGSIYLGTIASKVRTYRNSQKEQNRRENKDEN